MITSSKDALQRFLISDERQEIKRHKEGKKLAVFDLDATEKGLTSSSRLWALAALS
jgi:hypothetical protein